MSSEFLRFVSDHFAHCCAKSAAIDVDNGWMLSKDSGDQLLYSKHLSDWIGAVRALAGFHSEAIGYVEQASACFPSNPLSYDAFADLIHCSESMQYWEMNGEQVEKLYSILPRLKSAIKNIASACSSMTICHGDAHARNVLVDASGNYAWFDWRESHIGNPLTDIGCFLWWITPDRKKLGIGLDITAMMRERRYQEYMEALSNLASLPDIREVILVSLMHRSVNFHQRYRCLDLGKIKPYVPYTLMQLIRFAEDSDKREATG